MNSAARWGPRRVTHSAGCSRGPASPARDSSRKPWAGRASPSPRPHMNGGTEREGTHRGHTALSWRGPEGLPAFCSHSDLLSRKPSSGLSVCWEAEQDPHGHLTAKHEAAQGRGQSNLSGKATDRRCPEGCVGVQQLETRTKEGPSRLGSSTGRGRGERQACSWRDQQGEWGPGGLGLLAPS